MLGLVSGLVAVVLMRSIFWAEDLGTELQGKLRLPAMLRPAVAGLCLGAMAIWFPHIIGVGYKTTSRALSGNLVFHEAVIFAMLKVAAVSITMGGRMGGGVFSPALMVGALTGLAYGLVATAVFPEVSGSETLYALAGMGAVAAAVLGAPISTTLVVFELTGDWQTGLAVMVAVSISTALASRLVDRSFFLTQLERRGIHLAAGPQAYLLAMFKVSSVMKAPEHPRAPMEDRIRRAAQRSALRRADRYAGGRDAALRALQQRFPRGRSALRQGGDTGDHRRAPARGRASGLQPRAGGDGGRGTFLNRADTAAIIPRVRHGSAGRRRRRPAAPSRPCVRSCGRARRRRRAELRRPRRPQ